MPCSGRTQRSDPSPQCIDLGHGKSATIRLIVSARISAAGAPCPLDHGEIDAVAVFELVLAKARLAEEAFERLRRRRRARAL